jgi:hypothetical protein
MAVAGIEREGPHLRAPDPVSELLSPAGQGVGYDQLLTRRFLRELEGGHGPHRATAQHQDFHKLLFSR